MDAPQFSKGEIALFVDVRDNQADGIHMRGKQQLFARAFFKNVRPGITIGVIAGREQVEKYMSGAWWNNDPVIAARNIHIEWGGIQNDY